MVTVLPTLNLPPKVISSSIDLATTIFFGNDQTRPNGITSATISAATSESKPPMNARLCMLNTINQLTHGSNMTATRSLIKCIILSILAYSISVHAQTAAVPLTIPHQVFLGTNGLALAGGKVNTFSAGTSTAKSTFIDSTATTQNPPQITLDAGGGANIWLGSSCYKFVVTNSSGVLQWSADNVCATNLGSVANIISSGCTIPTPATSGFIRMCNGDLINWENFAGAAAIGLSQGGIASSATGNVADVLRYGTNSTGAVQARRFIDFSNRPAQSGVLATGNNVCAVASSNAAGNGDVCAAQVNAVNLLALSPLAETSFQSTDTITSLPLGSGAGAGWKFVLGGNGNTNNMIAVGQAAFTEVHYIAGFNSSGWLSLFPAANLPANNAIPATPDTGSTVSLGSNGMEVLTEVSAQAVPGSGFDGCYADSTAHLRKCAYNGGNFHGLRLTEVGTCTMVAGTCTLTWGTAFAATPLCNATWNGTGTLTGIVKAVPSGTTCVVTSSVNTDTAVMQIVGTANPN